MLGPVPGLSAQAETAAVPEGLRLDVVVEYYAVEEPTLNGVVTRLNQTRLEGPGAARSQGLTRYSILPQWRAMAGGGVCRAENVEVDVNITITLPRWPDVRRRPYQEQVAWETIETAIREHEFVHRDLTRAAAVRLLEQLQGVEARGCRTLRQVVESRVAIEDHRLREAHEELDRTTPSRLPIG